MKTEEDEAFEDIERRQGGFQAKRQMAMDKYSDIVSDGGLDPRNKMDAQPAQEPPSEWAGIKAILDEYGLQAIDFVADFKEALAQPAQEPVAWMVVGDGKFGNYELGQVFEDCEDTTRYWANRGYELVPVYTTPPQRPWVGLTAEETSGFTSHEMTVVKYVSKVLQEKNGD